MFGGLNPFSISSRLHKCSVALFNADDAAFKWHFEIPNTSKPDFGCVTANTIVCGIQHAMKSSVRGLIRIKRESGTQIGETKKVSEIHGLASLRGDDLVYGNLEYENDFVCNSYIHLKINEEVKSLLISTDPYKKIYDITEVTKDKFVVTLQHTVGKMVSFIHQLWDKNGSCLWENSSKNDSVASFDEQIMTFNNAAKTKSTKIEVVNIATGSLCSEQHVIRSSIANITHVTSKFFVYCDPNYNMIVYDLERNTTVTTVAFPDTTPGWLHFAVDREGRYILACKTNNFTAPETTIALFTY